MRFSQKYATAEMRFERTCIASTIPAGRFSHDSVSQIDETEPPPRLTPVGKE